ncbi:class I SAM-dependent methyltransferase [Arsenicitalea aurantiaca]|uniref:Class I SAM-dependent methyltransferase n=1 Tax=Arsenicitalea aurantiaca TaxID=1783274 RepID=A0A433XBD6_9HYPH|nr:class I SAM-dependent methyltransferase [Arsenicitalea aurantiaca]RUT31386.1 class I SAM-dependent methyltransferase [Arsenicitalea aurantiaca]
MPIDTTQFYDANAAVYAEDGSVNPRLGAFLGRVRPGGLVLELGTGSGRDARAMIEAGFRVEATDGSAGLARIASDYLGQAVKVMRFEELAAEAAYDGVYASAALLHVQSAFLPEMVGRVHRALLPGGVAWASFKAGQGEGLDGLGRYYNYPEPTGLLALWRAAAPWAELSLEGWTGTGYDERPTEWIAITAVR